jgi:hypothetical protein
MSLNQQTLKQRVNMVVMRMIAQNSDQDQRSALQPQVEARPQVSIALIKQCVDPDRSLKIMLDRSLKLSKVKIKYYIGCSETFLWMDICTVISDIFNLLKGDGNEK